MEAANTHFLCNKFNVLKVERLLAETRQYQGHCYCCTGYKAMLVFIVPVYNENGKDLWLINKLWG